MKRSAWRYLWTAKDIRRRLLLTLALFPLDAPLSSEFLTCKIIYFLSGINRTFSNENVL